MPGFQPTAPRLALIPEAHAQRQHLVEGLRIQAQDGRRELGQLNRLARRDIPLERHSRLVRRHRPGVLHVERAARPRSAEAMMRLPSVTRSAGAKYCGSLPATCVSTGSIGPGNAA